MQISFYKIKSIFIFLLIFTISLYLFSQQIQPDNEYIGMKTIELNFRFFIILILNFILIILIIKYKNTLCNNFINMISFLVLLWFLIFFDLIEEIDLNHYVVLITIILIPILLFNLFVSKLILFYKNINLTIYKFNFLSFIDLKIILSTILLLTIILIGNKMPLDFNFLTSYERRSLGSELITEFSAYLFSMSMNGIAPYLAFLSVIKKKYNYFFIALLFVICCFGFIGVKAPILYVFFFGFLGFFIAKKRFNLSYFILIIIFIILFGALIEYFIFDFSWIADIIVRRAFVAVAQNQLYFVDFFLNYFNFDEWFIGMGSNITYIIGDFYYPIPTNANVNALLYEIGRNGIFGYIIMILFLLFFFSFLDYVYLKYNNKEFLGIGILYMILLLEQSYSTAFITSGVCMITILTFLTINDKEYNEK